MTLENLSVEIGMRVRIKSVLREQQGFEVRDLYKANRRPNAIGTLSFTAPKHHGVVWFVKHDSGEMAVYATHEFVVLEQVNCD